MSKYIYKSDDLYKSILISENKDHKEWHTCVIISPIHVDVYTRKKIIEETIKILENER